MIICFTTDLHGRANLYEQTTELAQRAAPDLLIFGGDMLPDCEMTHPGPAQVEFVQGWLADWLDGFRRHLPTCQVATIFGNHDWQCSADAIEAFEAEGLLTVLRPDRPAEFEGWKVLGYSCSPPSPFFSKDFERLDRPDDTPPVVGGCRWSDDAQAVVQVPAPDCFTAVPSIEEDLARMPAIDGQWIFVSHSPPHASGLDLLITGQPVGSRAVRTFLERRQPVVSLHGHLHDSPFKSGRFYERIGKTIAINPGQGTATLAAVTFDPSDAASTMTAHGVRLPAG